MNCFHRKLNSQHLIGTMPGPKGTLAKSGASSEVATPWYWKFTAENSQEYNIIKIYVIGMLIPDILFWCTLQIYIYILLFIFNK